jgi:hypothetical protein
MKHFDFLEGTNEYELSQQVEHAINNLNFDNEKFAACIPRMHRTLQQSLWRTIRECIKVYADEEYGYDARNKSAHEDAKAMLQYLEEHGRHIPMI